MRNMLALVGLLLVVFVAVGFWRQWFTFSVDSDKNVNFKVNGQKVIQESKQGLEIGAEKLRDAAENLKKDKDGSPTGTPTPATTAGPNGK